MIARDASLGLAAGGQVESFYSMLNAHAGNIAPLEAHVSATMLVGLAGEHFACIGGYGPTRG